MIKKDIPEPLSKEDNLSKVCNALEALQTSILNIRLFIAILEEGCKVANPPGYQQLEFSKDNFSVVWNNLPQHLEGLKAMIDENINHLHNIFFIKNYY